MKKHRILYVTRVVEGGVAVVLSQLAQALDRNKYEPVVVLDSHVKSDLGATLSSKNIKVIDRYIETPYRHEPINTKKKTISERLENSFGQKAIRPYLELKAAQEFFLKQLPTVKFFLKIIRKYKIELVHTHDDLRRGKPELIAAKLAGIPVISHIHGYNNPKSFDNLFSFFVDRFIYISNDIFRYHNAAGKPPQKGVLIHNGVSIGNHEDQGRDHSIRRIFGFLPSDIIVGIVGRIDWWKGHEYFIEAFAKISSTNDNVKGLIIGGLVETNLIDKRNESYFKKIKAMVAELGLENKLIITGFKKYVQPYISMLDMAVHASSTPEPFGLVIIECMAAGKPVIATKAGGVIDIIDNNINGILVPCKDADAIAESIAYLTNNKKEAREMGEMALLHVKENFTVDQQKRKVEALYDSLLLNAG